MCIAAITLSFCISFWASANDFSSFFLLCFFCRFAATGTFAVSGRFFFVILFFGLIRLDRFVSRIGRLFDLRPAAIVKRFGLKNPIFEATASYGHFGNRPYKQVEKVWENGREVEREIEYFGWEKLDAVDCIRKEFGL